MEEQKLDDEVIALCEERGLGLRPGLAVLAIFAGRADEAKRLMDKDAPALPAPPKQTAELVSWKPEPKHPWRGKKPTGKPAKPAGPGRHVVTPPPATNMKICTKCGEAKGYRAFAKGDDTCTACATGERNPFKRAASLADAENMDD